MEKIVIRTIEDLDRVIPRLVPYAPPAGSIIVLDVTARPVAILRPETLVAFAERGSASLASDLAVFGGRNIFTYVVTGGIGDYRTLVNEALAIVGAIPLSDYRPIDAGSFNLQDRDQYVANGGEEVLDEAYERCWRVAAGIEERPA